VLISFGTLDPVILCRILTTFCFSFYGSVLWDLEHNAVISVCTAWRKGLRRVWGLPYNSHGSILAALALQLPLYDELHWRSLTFTQRCLVSENLTVAYLSKQAIWFERRLSPMGRNLWRGLDRWGLKIRNVLELVKRDVFEVVNNRRDDDVVARAAMLLELIAERRSTFSFGQMLDASDVEALIAWISVF